MSVTVSKQQAEFSNEILISVKSPRPDTFSKTPLERKNQPRLAEPPDLKKRNARLGPHITTVKLKERDPRTGGHEQQHEDDQPNTKLRDRSGNAKVQGRSQPRSKRKSPLPVEIDVCGEFKLRSNSGGLDLVQTTPLFIPWKVIDGGRPQDEGSLDHSSYGLNIDSDPGPHSEVGRCQEMFPHAPQGRKSPKKRVGRGESTPSQGQPSPLWDKSQHTLDGKGCNFNDEAHCEICRHLMHYEYHMSLGDCRGGKGGSRERSSRRAKSKRKAQNDRRSSKALRGRKMTQRGRDHSSRDRASSRSKIGKLSTPECMKPQVGKDKNKQNDAKAKLASKKSNKERKRYVKALEKFISFKPQGMVSMKRSKKSRRNRNSSGVSASSKRE